VSQVFVTSDSYYASTHPYDANMIGFRPIIFAHCSLRLSDVLTLHCAVSQHSKVIPVATVRRGVSQNIRLSFGHGDTALYILLFMGGARRGWGHGGQLPLVPFMLLPSAAP